jgi:LmbE family N-acetylglucosaminyl deacetylase
MKTLSRRTLLQVSGLTAMGSLIELSGLAKVPKKDPDGPVRLKVVVFGAHPDDPESGCGGTMNLLATQGHEVVSAYLTKGEAGITGKTAKAAAKIRTEEALKACSILNARAEFLGQTDGKTEITAKRYDEVYNFFVKEDPDIVFTHWPIDTHRDHRICSILVYDAWLRLERKFALYYYEVESGFQTQNFSPTDYVDISHVVGQKSAACMAHESQHPEDWYSGVHKKMELFRGIEYNCEYAEAFVRQNLNPGKLV